MMKLLCRFSLVLLGAFYSLGESIAQVDSRPPNILLIVGDDMGYADVGFHGCTDIPTPHLDSLARSGVICSQGYVSGPYCSPTRAGLLTGRYQQRFGHEFNPSGPELGLPITQSTIADRLQGIALFLLQIAFSIRRFLPRCRQLLNSLTQLIAQLGYLAVIRRFNILMLFG